jgi:hypothetical protein
MDRDSRVNKILQTLRTRIFGPKCNNIDDFPSSTHKVLPRDFLEDKVKWKYHSAANIDDFFGMHLSIPLGNMNS